MISKLNRSTWGKGRRTDSTRTQRDWYNRTDQTTSKINSSHSNAHSETHSNIHSHLTSSEFKSLSSTLLPHLKRLFGPVTFLDRSLTSTDRLQLGFSEPVSVFQRGSRFWFLYSFLVENDGNSFEIGADGIQWQTGRLASFSRAIRSPDDCQQAR